MESEKQIKSQITNDPDDQKVLDLAITSARDEAANFKGPHYIANRPLFILWHVFINENKNPQGLTPAPVHPVLCKN